MQAAPTKAVAHTTAPSHGNGRIAWHKRLRRRMLGDNSPLSALLDLSLYPLVVPAGILLKNVRTLGFRRLPRCRNALVSIGVMPIADHYYEPLINPAALKRPLSDRRELPGIDWNIDGQLALLQRFDFVEELRRFPEDRPESLTFFYNNRFFEPGDAECWYSIIRTFKPKRIFEIGSGNSTLLAAAAIARSAVEDPQYTCHHLCIEPYENDWLESLNVTVIRKPVEDVELDLFRELEANDILFIDSSHIIRPQGDVLFEYLSLLPMLRSGVIVHVHDIFSPRDYPARWLVDDARFWNEQYLLEAFLSHNAEWEILAALNVLKHEHFERLRAKCPYLTGAHEPASFYIRRR